MRILPGKFNVFRTHLQAFILVFPHEGRVKLQKLREQLSGGFFEEDFSAASGVFECGVVIAHLAALAVIPVRDGVGLGVFFAPVLKLGLNAEGEIFERLRCLPAMEAEQSVGHNISSEKGKERRTAAFGDHESRRGCCQAFVPNLTFIGLLRGETRRAYQWM